MKGRCYILPAMSQIEWLYEQLQSLSTITLIQIIDELHSEIPDNDYKQMATNIYNKAKRGETLTHKQKNVLVNIIGQRPKTPSQDH